MSNDPGLALDLIPAHELVIIDATICLYVIRQVSAQCELFLGRCATGEISGIIPCHILAEIMHQLMMAEARDYQWIKGPNPAKQMAGLPERVRSLNRYESLVRDILGLGLQIEPVVQEDFITAMDVQRRSGLLTNDALTVAVGERLRVTSIASADKAFARVPGVSVYAPNDLNR